MKALLVISMLMMSVFLSPIVIAQEEATNRQEAAQQRQAELQQQRQELQEQRDSAREQVAADKAERIAARCVAVVEKITTHQASLIEQKQSHETIYTNLVGRVDAVLESLSTEGVDVTAVTEISTKLKAELLQLSVDFAAYEAALQVAVDVDCANLDAQTIVDSLSDARLAHQVLFAMRETVNATIADELKPAITALKESLSE